MMPCMISEYIQCSYMPMGLRGKKFDRCLMSVVCRVVTWQMTWGNTAGAIDTSLTRWGGGCTTVGLTRSCGFGCVVSIHILY